ncbi:MAG: phosphoribosylformylglycinamidine synthase, partial [Oscillospiraceae bacterium]|nr:phosphoribosylformylglycinamidine synthase [Oscillospiraceae bacterium]
MSVFRIYVEKKKEFAVEANGVLADLKTVLQIKNLDGVRVLNRYDVEGISEEIFESAKATVFSEPQVDVIYDELPEAKNELVFATEYLPGQFDQRADSCAQCISLLAACDQPTVKTARIFYLAGALTDEDFAKIKAYLVNPVESREASLEKYTSLKTNYTIPTEVATMAGFIGFSEAELSAFIKDNGLAMDLADILFCQKYFKDEEKRNPTITEIKMIDTYWSDH